VKNNENARKNNKNARSKMSKVVAMWGNVNYGGLHEVRDDATLSYGKLW
jgi:hypothetical protein